MNNDFPRINIDTRKLIERVEVLIKDAEDIKDRIDFGAVNWGHLHVLDVEYRVSMLDADPQPECVVRIEEADSPRLAVWLTKQLDEFPGTHVECEW